MSCECNDYSKLQALTGIANLSSANPNLDGTGAMQTVLISAGANGTIVKSVIVKATEATETGMVRLFVANPAGTTVTLIREIPIVTNPSLAATPTPTPILPMLEFDLVDPIYLRAGYELRASTQYTQTINVIAEGLDRSYPVELPPVCCNFKQTTEATGNVIIDVANPNMDGSGSISVAFTSTGASGTVINSITISALQSTHEGMIRLFISPPGGPPVYSLWMEINIPETEQSSFEPSYKVELQEDYHLENGYVIGASTQLSEKFALTIQGTGWSYPI